MGAKKRKRLYFVVPFYLDGHVEQMRLYSKEKSAAKAVERYVRYDRLSDEVALQAPAL